LRVLLGLDDHEDGTDSTNNVDADILAVGVLDAALEQLEELVGVVTEVEGIFLEDGVKKERANLTSNDIVAVVEREKLLQEVLTLAILGVDTNNASDETGQGVTDRGLRLLEGSLEQVVSSKLALIRGSIGPELGHEASGLNGGKLSDTTITVGEGNLDEREKGLRLGVVVLLEFGGDGLDLLRVGDLTPLE
jgi:hypothetical protein